MKIAKLKRAVRAKLPPWLKSLLKPLKTLFRGLISQDSIPQVLTDEFIHLNQAAAQRCGVEAAVHPDDFMYWHMLNNPTFPSTNAAIESYFTDGGESARMLAAAIAPLSLPTDRPIRLLEFASGYGRVTRHLKTNPRFEIVACDIHPAAVDFLAQQIGVSAIPSADEPEGFSPSEKFDVVFALSFFSHMPRKSFGRWLRALFDCLATPGYLVFTTHGLASHKMHGSPLLSEDGFSFTLTSEQQDLETAQYGSTISTPEFVIAELFRQTGAPIVEFKQAHWWKHQDHWIVKRA